MTEVHARLLQKHLCGYASESVSGVTLDVQAPSVAALAEDSARFAALLIDTNTLSTAASVGKKLIQWAQAYTNSAQRRLEHAPVVAA